MSAVPLTRDQVERSLPANLKGAATQSLTDKINNISVDPVFAEQVRHNFIGYTHILKEGRFKTEDYLHAVVYVSYKLMNYTNQEAYFRTFPQRHSNWLAQGISAKDISAYVSAYHKGKLVNLVMEQTLTPVHVLNMDIYQKAIMVQADLMINANSEKVKSDAANSLLTHLAKPKENSVAVSIDVKQSGMDEMKDMIAKLAETQRGLIIEGTPIKTITNQRLIPLEDDN